MRPGAISRATFRSAWRVRILICARCSTRYVLTVRVCACVCVRLAMGRLRFKWWKQHRGANRLCVFCSALSLWMLIVPFVLVPVGRYVQSARLRVLPVVRHARIVGFISKKDILRHRRHLERVRCCSLRGVRMRSDTQCIAIFAEDRTRLPNSIGRRRSRRVIKLYKSKVHPRRVHYTFTKSPLAPAKRCPTHGLRRSPSLESFHRNPATLYVISSPGKRSAAYQSYSTGTG